MDCLSHNTYVIRPTSVECLGWIVYCAQYARSPMEMPLRHMENMLTHWRLSSYAIRTGWPGRSVPHSHATHSAHMHSLSFNFQLSIRPPPPSSDSISATLIPSYDTIQTQMFSVSHAWAMYHTLTHASAHTHTRVHESARANIAKCNENATTAAQWKALPRDSSAFQWTIFGPWISSIRSAAQSFTTVAANFPACGLDWCASAVVCALGLRREFYLRVHIPLRRSERFSVYKCKGTRSNQNSSLLLPVRGSSFSSPTDRRTTHTHRSMCLCRPFSQSLCKMFSSVNMKNRVCVALAEPIEST